jgi:hypothetical protein
LRGPPVFRGCRGILTACFAFLEIAPPETAIRIWMYWSANEKEETQATKPQAVSAAGNTLT